jgi:hypothetical protein
VGVNQIRGLQAMKCPYSPDNARENESTVNETSKSSGQRKVAKPMRQNCNIVRLMSFPTERVDHKHSISDTHFGQPCKRFGDKATTCIIVTGGIKRRKR